MTGNELFGRFVGYTALITGWVFADTLLIFAGVVVIMMEIFTNWREQ